MPAVLLCSFRRQGRYTFWYISCKVENRVHDTLAAWMRAARFVHVNWFERLLSFRCAQLLWSIVSAAQVLQGDLW